MATVITGHVLARDGRPLDHVELSIGGEIVGHSGSHGFFSIDAPRKSGRVAVTFRHEGFVTNTRIFHTRAGAGNTVVIWPVANRAFFDPSRDLDVQFHGGRIQIPANAITTERGEPVLRAELRFTWFDITNARDRAAASGDFSGRLADGSTRRLNSYGIFDLDVVADGARLQLKPRTKVALAINVPERPRRKPPKSMGHFNFDANLGIWIWSGTFELASDGLTYNGHVFRFGGSHNLDDPQDTTCITVQVINWWDSSPMAGFTTIAHGLQYDSYGTTDNNGMVCLLVQRNASFTLEAYGSIGSSHFATPNSMQPTYSSPNFSSGASDCGDPVQCPFVGTVPVDLIVGIGRAFASNSMSTA
ncbi:MAG: hypothetical protein JO093_04580 [Acidobacteria bacterium]|nr:hypothetical protein [Acidobacteriota bacterium]MBV9070057.1 hypothetical protein [Acidobacteriota bacterium]MBV9184868.1 hypothetical protein [Acidobacteriota bacterium]